LVYFPQLFTGGILACIAILSASIFHKGIKDSNVLLFCVRDENIILKNLSNKNFSPLTNCLPYNDSSWGQGQLLPSCSELLMDDRCL
jgi:hypothetical protein